MVRAILYIAAHYYLGMETESKGLTLELAMKIVGTFPILMGIGMIFAPTMMMEGFGMGATEGMILVASYLGVCMVIFGGAHWMAALFVVDNLKLFAQFFAAGHFAFILVDVYQYSVDVLPVDAANLGNNVVTLVFVALLLIKSRD
jgi:hypothetical protein